MIRNFSRYRSCGSILSSSSSTSSSSALSKLCFYSTTTNISSISSNSSSSNSSSSSSSNSNSSSSSSSSSSSGSKIFNDIWSTGNPSNLKAGKLRLALQKLLINDGGIPYMANTVDIDINSSSSSNSSSSIKTKRSDVFIKKKKILKAITNSNDDNNIPLLQDLFQLDTITPPLLSSVLQCFESFNADDLALELYKSLHVTNRIEFNDKHIVSLFKVLKCNASKRITDAINIYNDIITTRESSKTNSILLKHIIELIVAAKVDDDDRYYYSYARNAFNAYYSSGGKEKISDYTYLILLAGRTQLANRDALVNDLWNEIMSKGFTPTVYTYTAKMSSMISSGNILEALETYQDMLQKNVSPSRYY